jgi:hypothetical protein
MLARILSLCKDDDVFFDAMGALEAFVGLLDGSTETLGVEVDVSRAGVLWSRRFNNRVPSFVEALVCGGPIKPCTRRLTSGAGPANPEPMYLYNSSDGLRQYLRLHINYNTFNLAP